MYLDLRLDDLPLPRIDAIRLSGAAQTLQGITSRNRAKAAEGAESRPSFKRRKEQMKRRLMERGSAVTFEQATYEVGRERLLLSLYLEYAQRSDASWLPAFDKFIAKSVLGINGCEWHSGRRRQATLLFFTHFRQLPEAGLAWLCERLLEAYGALDSVTDGQVARWRQHRKVLFNSAGDQNVARAATREEALPSLMERFAVPSGRFAECLRQVFLLNALRNSPFGKEIPALAQIESIKTERASLLQLMGAAALQIMVQRVTEGGRKWSGDWPRWITKLGCDPRHGRSSGEGAKWWGWATENEFRLAQQGITGLTLGFFIDFLRQSLRAKDKEKEAQFELRSRFLLGLHEAGKIQSARLALNRADYQRLDRNYRDGTVAILSATTDETSMICLRCVDDIFVIEGTHNFGLRMFHKSFPVRGFWDHPKQTYQDQELRISPKDCHVFLRHDHGGRWVNEFYLQLRNRFHVEWEDVRR
jgi:EH signature protein